MEYTVTIRPSGHRFVAYKNETILEAGLRAGYNLKYQCDSGSCGECKARLVSGEVNRIKSGDLCLTRMERGRGYFLPCSCEAKGDCEMEAVEFGKAEDVPYQEIVARVRKISRVNGDILILQLRTPRTNTLRFLAGQSATIELPDGGSRTLQIASCPCNGMVLEFHVRRRREAFDRHLFERLATGEEVMVKGPVGEFTLDEQTRRPLLFIAYDTGFAGVKSLIEHAIALELEQDIHLYRITCNPEQDYMRNVCRAWDDAIDNLRHHTFEHCVPIDCSDKAKADACGRFMLALEKGGNELIARSDVYLSGVEDMIVNLGKTLVDRGLPEARLKVQRVS